MIKLHVPLYVKKKFIAFGLQKINFQLSSRISVLGSFEKISKYIHPVYVYIYIHIHIYTLKHTLCLYTTQYRQ